MAVALWNGWTWVEMSLPPIWVSALCFGKKGEKWFILILMWLLNLVTTWSKVVVTAAAKD